MSLRLVTGRSITEQNPAGNFEQAMRRHASVDFQTQNSIGKICPDVNEHVLFL